jgi:ribonuclease HII
MKLPSLAQLRRLYLYEARPLPARVAELLQGDPRAGARALLAVLERRRAASRAEARRLRRMLRYEEPLWARGVGRVAGIDEAGMSPLAGPVAAAAVVLPPHCQIPGVDDSKKLNPETRERLAASIREVALAWSVAFSEPEEIDRLNIYWAGILAMRRAVEGLGVAPEHLLIDARRIPDLSLPQQPIVQGDQKSLSIAAASILAKTARDARMRELDARYPGYGFARHKGYPVREHLQALERLGACPIHRRSFEPVRRALGLEPEQGDLFL